MNGTSRMNQRIETINELLELLAALLTTVRRLPPGPERHAALKQVGLFQVRLDTLAAQVPARDSLEQAAPAAVGCRGGLGIAAPSE
jgi:hypothetical protein